MEKAAAVNPHVVQWIEEAGPNGEKSRRERRLVQRTILLVFSVLTALIFPFANVSMAAPPTIEGQNPDNDGPGNVLSDKEDGTDGLYHFVARVGDDDIGIAGHIQTVTVHWDDGDSGTTPNVVPQMMSRVGTTDAWELFYDLSSVTPANGTGTVTFTVVDFDGSIDTDAVPVTFDNTAQTVEIVEPANGEPLQFVDRDGDGRPEAIITGTVSSDMGTTDTVNVFYSTSSASSDPTWTSCGAATPTAQDTFTAQCKLAPTVTPSSVTMVAARAVKTTPCTPLFAGGPCSPLDPATSPVPKSGDAHRVQGVLGAVRVDAEPDPDTNPVNTSHTITLTVTDGDAAPISSATVFVEYAGKNDPDDTNSTTTATADDRCITGSGGTCTVVLGPSANQGNESPPVTETTTESGTTTITAWVGANPESAEDPQPDDSDATDVALKFWQAGPPKTLDCNPENAGPNPSSGAGSAEGYVCDLRDEFNNPVSGTAIDGENLNGANDPDDDATGSPTPTADYDDACETGPGGTCTATVTAVDEEAGSADICFWADTDRDSTFDANAPGDTEEDGDLCNNETRTAPERNNLTDVVGKTWQTATATVLDVEPETAFNPTGTVHTITATAFDQFDRPISDTAIDFEVTGSGDADGNTPSSPDKFCTTDGDGQCTVTITSTATERTTVRGWIDSDGNHEGPVTHGAVEADMTEGRDEASQSGTVAEPDNTDVVEKTWTTPPSPSDLRMDCDPETETNTVLEEHRVTCTVTDQTGTVSGIKIDAENLNGANDRDDDAVGGPSSPADHNNICTTGAGGTCTATITATEGESGPADICFWADTDNDEIYNSQGDQLADGDGCDEEPASAEDDDNPTDIVRKQWESVPAISISDVFEDEGDSGPTPFVFIVFMDQPSSQTVTVNYSTQNGSATAPSDYVAASGTITFVPGDNSEPVTITVNGDTAVESDENFFVNLTNPQNATIADGQGEAHILDDDAPPPPQGYWIFEENGGVHARGAAGYFGSANGVIGAGSVATDGDSTPSGNGYWILESNGGVHARGGAGFFGGAHPFTPSGATGIAAHPSGCGYWILENNGGIHARGCAGFFGNVHGVAASNAVAIAATPSGNGYWILESNGGIHARGDAGFFGAAHPFTPSGSTNLDNHSSGCGYWVVENNGGVHARGCAGFFGAAHPFTPSGATGLSATPDNGGYWISENNGGVHARGAALFFGGVHGIAASPVTDIEGLGS